MIQSKSRALGSIESHSVLGIGTLSKHRRRRLCACIVLLLLLVLLLLPHFGASQGFRFVYLPFKWNRNPKSSTFSFICWKMPTQPSQISFHRTFSSLNQNKLYAFALQAANSFASAVPIHRSWRALPFSLRASPLPASNRVRFWLFWSDVAQHLFDWPMSSLACCAYW